MTIDHFSFGLWQVKLEVNIIWPTKMLSPTMMDKITNKAAFRFCFVAVMIILSPKDECSSQLVRVAIYRRHGQIFRLAETK